METDGYVPPLIAWDKRDGIGNVSNKELLAKFRDNNYFPMKEVKAGVYQGIEMMALLTPFVYERGKPYSRFVVWQWRKEWNGGVDF